MPQCLTLAVSLSRTLSITALTVSTLRRRPQHATILGVDVPFLPKASSRSEPSRMEYPVTCTAEHHKITEPGSVNSQGADEKAARKAGPSIVLEGTHALCLPSQSQVDPVGRPSAFDDDVQTSANGAEAEEPVVITDA